MSWQEIYEHETLPAYKARRQQFYEDGLTAGYDQISAILRADVLIEILAQEDAKCFATIRAL